MSVVSAGRRLLVSALLLLVLLPLGVSNASATAIPPAPEVQKVREAFLVANPQLTRFTVEIDGLTPTIGTLNGFTAWYAANPKEVLSVVTFLHNPANSGLASHLYAWVAAHPD